MGFNEAYMTAGHTVTRTDGRNVFARNNTQPPGGDLEVYYYLTPTGDFEVVQTAPRHEGELWFARYSTSFVLGWVAVDKSGTLEWVRIETGDPKDPYTGNQWDPYR